MMRAFLHDLRINLVLQQPRASHPNDLKISKFASQNYTKIKIGDWVEIFGKSVSIGKFARSCDTISYEIASKISSRVKKMYINSTDEEN